jgi:hypothetical protein
VHHSSKGGSVLSYYQGARYPSIAVSDSNDSNDDEFNGDTYDYWPAKIVNRLSNGSYVISVGYGFGISSETGSFAGIMRVVDGRVLRPGLSKQLQRIKKDLDAKVMVTK